MPSALGTRTRSPASPRCHHKRPGPPSASGGAWSSPAAGSSVRNAPVAWAVAPPAAPAAVAASRLHSSASSARATSRPGAGATATRTPLDRNVPSTVSSNSRRFWPGRACRGRVRVTGRGSCGPNSAGGKAIRQPGALGAVINVTRTARSPVLTTTSDATAASGPAGTSQSSPPPPARPPAGRWSWGVGDAPPSWRSRRKVNSPPRRARRRRRPGRHTSTSRTSRPHSPQ